MSVCMYIYLFVGVSISLDISGILSMFVGVWDMVRTSLAMTFGILTISMYAYMDAWVYAHYFIACFGPYLG